MFDHMVHYHDIKCCIRQTRRLKNAFHCIHAMGLPRVSACVIVMVDPLHAPSVCPELCQQISKPAANLQQPASKWMKSIYLLSSGEEVVYLQAFLFSPMHNIENIILVGFFSGASLYNYVLRIGGPRISIHETAFVAAHDLQTLGNTRAKDRSGVNTTTIVTWHLNICHWELLQPLGSRRTNIAGLRQRG